MEFFKRIKRIFNEMTMKLRSHSKKEQPLCPPANIQTLPEEVLIEIFSYLSLGELCNTVPKVCKQWKRLHWDRQLYYMPRILGESSIEDLLKVLDSAAHLKSPHFEQKHIIETVRKSLLETRHEVKDVTGELTKLFMILSHLTEVNLMGRDSCNALQLAPLVRCCVQLQTLEVSGYHRCITNAELIPLCESLCGTLRVLHLYYCKWTQEGARALTKCRLLRDLYIMQGVIDRITAECLFEIANISSLRHLKICGCTVNEQTWITMFSNDALKGLTRLRLSYNVKVSDKVAVAIGANLSNLTDLYISSSVSLGNNGLRSIITGCNKLTSLELVFSGSQATERDILMIPTCLPRLRTLVLRLRNPKLDSINWESALKKKMPGLLILGLDIFGRSY